MAYQLPMLWPARGYSRQRRTPTEPFAAREKAKAMMESVLLSEVQPTRMSRILAKNIILSVENTSPSYTSREFMELATSPELSRAWIGETLSFTASFTIGLS
ncbi:hypothetical protein VTN02DRAFT_2606 [Thermoascus thermophilus]